MLLPYAIISFIFLAAFWPQYVEWFRSEGRSTNFLVAYLGGLATGTIQLQFWYIPILAALFALTPALAFVLRRPGGVWLAAVIALAPLVVSRTIFPQFLSVQTVVYFAGAYMLGMLAGSHYKKALALVAAWRSTLWVTAIGCSGVLYLLFLNQYTPEGLHSTTQSLFYLQKCAIAALVLHALACREDRLPPWMSTLGTYAFSIYFLHFMVVFGVASAISAAAAGRESGPIAIMGGFGILLAALTLSTLVSAGLKKLLGRFSRPIIGA